VRAGLDPHSADSDGDGLLDADEVRAGLDPLGVDTDGDGIDDRQEAHSGGKLDPKQADTDGDGLTDGEKLAIGTAPTKADSDGFDTHGDGLTDAEEVALGTDPNHYDKGDDPTSDERGVLQKSFEMLLLDDPIGTIATLGTAKLVSAVGKAGAARINSLVKALRNAKTVQEAAAIRRKLIAEFRERLKPNKVDPTEAAERKQLYERLAQTLNIRKQRIDELVDDPVRGIDDTTRFEARDAVNLEDAGAVRGPLRRPDPQKPDENGADFVDSTGRLWDHKRAISSSRFNPQRFVRSLEVRDIPNGESIMLNHEALNADDRIALRFGRPPRGCARGRGSVPRRSDQSRARRRGHAIGDPARRRRAAGELPRHGPGQRRPHARRPAVQRAHRDGPHRCATRRRESLWDRA